MAETVSTIAMSGFPSVQMPIDGIPFTTTNDGNNITSITKTYLNVTYKLTLTYDNNLVASSTGWVPQP